MPPPVTAFALSDAGALRAFLDALVHRHAGGRHEQASGAGSGVKPVSMG